MRFLIIQGFAVCGQLRFVEFNFAFSFRGICCVLLCFVESSLHRKNQVFALWNSSLSFVELNFASKESSFSKRL